MSARDFQRQMLAELMGAQTVEDGDLTFDDDRVCKNFLCGLCPHDLFSNTKNELGACPKTHMATLKEKYEEARKDKDYGYEARLIPILEDHVRECDVKIGRLQQRLDQTIDLSPEASAKDREVKECLVEIGETLSTAEAMGAEGSVAGSMAMMEKVEQLKERRKQLENDMKQLVPQAAQQQQKLRVCECCAAYLSIFDNDRRLADHFGGKMHMGFSLIRSRLKELREAARRAPPPSSSSRDRDRSDRDRSDRDRSDRGSRDRGDRRDDRRDYSDRGSSSRSSHDYDRDRYRDRRDDRRY